MLLTKAQIAAAEGRIFHAPGVIVGCSKVRFAGIWPSGNVGVKPSDDRNDFGPLTVSADRAKPLIDEINTRIDRNGTRR